MDRAGSDNSDGVTTTFTAIPFCQDLPEYDVQCHHCRSNLLHSTGFLGCLEQSVIDPVPSQLHLSCLHLLSIDTGAGGQQEPYLVNGANSLTFGLMIPGCLIFSALATRFGLKKILIIGTLGYAPYAASLYTNK